MHKQIICTLSLLALIGVKPATAMDKVDQYIPRAQKVGEARMRVMFWDIYDAMLLAPNGKWNAAKPFALKLTYLRHLDGSKIADRAVQEMRGQGISNEVKLATWHTQMQQIFPNVDEGDTLTAIFTQDEKTVFLNDETEIGRINDAEFTKNFSAIWLSPKTSAPEMRLSLLGQKTMKGPKEYEILERTDSDGTASIY